MARESKEVLTASMYLSYGVLRARRELINPKALSIRRPCPLHQHVHWERREKDPSGVRTDDVVALRVRVAQLAELLTAKRPTKGPKGALHPSPTTIVQLSHARCTMAPLNTLRLECLPSLRRQRLFSELYVRASPLSPCQHSHTNFISAALRQACPEGVFVTLTPDDPTLWSAVLFVRHGAMSSPLWLAVETPLTRLRRSLLPGSASLPDILSRLLS